MIPFAQFLDGVRQRRNVRVVDLAQTSGVDPHVLAEILGGTGTARMTEAVQLCQALGLSCASAFQGMTGFHLHTAPPGTDALLRADVDRFNRIYQCCREHALTLLQDLLLTPLTQSRGATLDPGVITTLALRQDTVLRIDLAYPYQLLPPTIRRAALAEGVMLVEDVASYAQRATMPGAPTAKTRRAREVLQRLAHSPIGMNKISSVLELDTMLPQKGIFFRMAWQLWTDPPPHSKLFILCCRWHEDGHTPWLAQLRSALARLEQPCPLARDEIRAARIGPP